MAEYVTSKIYIDLAHNIFMSRGTGTTLEIFSGISFSDIERIDHVKSPIETVRQSIPDGAIEVERERLKNGSQRSLI